MDSFLNSSMFTLQVRDFAKGLVMAIIGAVLVALQNSLTGEGIIHWNAIGSVALITGVSYLIKNYFSDSQGKFAGAIG